MTYDAPAAWGTGRLHCARIADSDLNYRTALFQDIRMVAHRPIPQPDSSDKSRAAVIADMAHWDKHGIGRWMVWHDQTRVGFCGLTLKPAYAGLNLSYHLAPAVWGNGWATELTEALIGQARNLTPSPSFLYGLVRPNNPASARVLEKCGFDHAGSRDLGGAPTDLWTLDVPA